MGDRFSRWDHRHRNVELMLRRMDVRLPGIGHNGGPPLDLSYEAWLWRRAVRKAWATPPREIALRRLRRAERLGIDYRELAAVILDTGHHVSAAILPLHHAVQWQRMPDRSIRIGEDPDLAARRRDFDGRLFLLLDERELPVASKETIAALARAARRHFAPQAEALLRLRDGSEASRHKTLRAFLAKHRLHPREAFLLGAEQTNMALAYAAGLAFFKPLIEWQPQP